MKTLIVSATLTISGLLFLQLCNCQDTNEKTVALNILTDKVDQINQTINEDGPLQVQKKEDVVINMEMIESFRRCYDKIQPFSFADYFRGDPTEISVKYMAYIRVRQNSTPDNLDQALKIEIEKINNELNGSRKFNTMIAYAEDKVSEPSKTLVQTSPAPTTKEQNSATKKDNSKIVKWTHIKS